jgi:hypothetical protein
MCKGYGEVLIAGVCSVPCGLCGGTGETADLGMKVRLKEIKLGVQSSENKKPNPR